MTLEAGATQRADHIAYHIFNKFALIVDNARNVVSEPREEAKADKWFNLETPESDAYTDSVRLYRYISQLGSSPPPLELQVLLTVPKLTSRQALVLHPPNSSMLRIEPTPTSVLLESWTLTFTEASDGSASSFLSSTGDVPAPTVYKNIMIVFRSLFTLLRILPSWKICKRLRRRPTRNGCGLGVMLRMRALGTDASTTEDTRYLGFYEPLSPSSPPLATATHTFEPVTHPMGIFSLAVTYLNTPHFELDTVEVLFSSRFLVSEAETEFTTTLPRNSQRESILGSPDSLSMRTSLPFKFSRPIDKTDRERTAFGLGLGTSASSGVVFRPGSAATMRSTSFSSTTSSRNVMLSPASQAWRSKSGSIGSSGSSSRQSREEGRDGLSSVAWSRRESMGKGRGLDLPSTLGPLLIRKSSLTSPFKSGTLSSGSPSIYSNSPSSKQASPSTGPSLPSVPAGRLPSNSSVLFSELAPDNASNVEETQKSMQSYEKDNVEALKKLLSKLKGLDLTDKIQGKIFRKASGGYADVYIGRLVDESKPIAIKQFRIYEQQSNPGKFIKSMVKELRVWSKVQHTNILPLKGYKLEVIHGTHWPSLSFITEWMEAGSMMKYIREKHNLDNVHLIRGIADGLCYLHTNNIIHGDLKSANVLISADGIPLLTDFGLSHLITSTSTFETATDGSKGSSRWQSPELVIPHDNTEISEHIHTMESDIWAFGMTGLEILTKDLPYANLKTDGQVFISLYNGILPPEPADLRYRQESDKELWELCKGCWVIDPLHRPSIHYLLQTINQIK